MERFDGGPKARRFFIRVYGCGPSIGIVSAGVVATLLYPLQALPDVLTGFEACTGIANDAQRLACYDAESARLRSDSTAPVAAAPPSAPPQVPLASPQDKFGQRDLVANAPAAKKEPELKELIANVTVISRRSSGALVMTLDNDQVWAEKVAATYFPVKVGDRITIKSGLLGSFRMISPGGRTTDVTRVR